MTDACVPRRDDSSRLRRLLIAAGVLYASHAAALHAEPAGPLEEVVVTATRKPQPALDVPLSIGRVGTDGIVLVDATHHAEILNRIPGVMIQQGSGQESLTAIRSPVLTGAGSCGAFLFLENGVPVRPVGFCNVNALYEVNTEQAQAVEVLRGPGSALYGSNAMFGTVNVIQPAPLDRPPLAASVDAGPSSYWRVKVAGRHDGSAADFGAAGLYTHDGGWRDDSGYDEAKFNATLVGDLGTTPARADLAVTNLDQETAGFITGKNAYRSLELSESNPTPGAFRNSTAVRLTGLLQPRLLDGAELDLRPFLRSSHMDFLQHFLLGQPVEKNGQVSGGLLTSIAWGDVQGWSVIVGADVELGQSSLEEYQDHPTTGGSAAANAIRPAGKHYDYEVRSNVESLYAQAERRFAERWRITAGVRAEWVTYDYDNRMLDGNTDDQGVPCTPAPCLYSRPADRTDHFNDWAPKLSVSYDFTPSLVGYATLTQGFRPPEMTELYRLQRMQRVADLQPEELDSVELGLKGAWSRVSLALAVYDMKRSGVILRESNGYNVDNGRTTHRGIEYDLRWRALPSLDVVAAGTYAIHRYDFSRRVDGGETLVAGNDIDTAPREIGRYGLEWRPTASVEAEAEWMVVGPYWLDAANAHRYGGYELVNLRGLWRFAPQWCAGLRVTNALDVRYADRADYSFGTYRYFPGEPRAVFAEIAWTM
ncbi:MAG TPA: TonB-dependent receptor [Steroidobacteraceae bacterium]|nr:TonB-dependent receptor [Steroidobacteraceae bacterium]